MPGTRSFHQLYVPNDVVKTMIICLYEQRWWVGIILEVDTEQGDSSKVKQG